MYSKLIKEKHNFLKIGSLMNQLNKILKSTHSIITNKTKDITLKGWISNKISNNSIRGLLVDTNDFIPREATVIIGNIRFNVLCNQRRNKPLKYPEHKFCGFSLKINTEIMYELYTAKFVVLKDKETNHVVAKVRIEIDLEDLLNFYDYNTYIKKYLYLVFKTSLFDRKWYKLHYLPNYRGNLTPEEHYFFIGWKLGFNPSQQFITNKFLNYDNYYQKSNICPLVSHLISKNSINFDNDVLPNNISAFYANEISQILKSEYFDEQWYGNQYKNSIAMTDLSPVEHFYYIGFLKGYAPSLKFDLNYYVSKYKDIRHIFFSNFKNPLLHFLNFGINEGRLPNLNCDEQLTAKNDKKQAEDIALLKKSELFNKEWYISTYNLPDSDDFDPFVHYYYEGWKKGFNPSLAFSSSFYVNKYKDVRDIKVCPLVHYIKYGAKELRKINKYIDNIDHYTNLIHMSGMFSEKWYKKKYQVEDSPIIHYLKYGWWNGCNPSLKFDNDEYLNIYMDVARVGIPPLVHYLTSGKKENRKFRSPFVQDTPNFLRKYLNISKYKKPLISVIVASYNYADLISRTIESILNQTYDNYEIVVVDDGSNDNSVEVISNYTRIRNNVFLYTHPNNENRGLMETLKLGLSRSSGDYVAFCESDDYWAPNCLEERVHIINSYNNVNVIVNDVELFGNYSKVEMVKHDVIIRKEKFKKTKVFISPKEFRIRNWILTFSCVMIKKSCLVDCNFDNNPFKPNLDWWLWRQICYKNYIYYIDKKLTFWYMHNSYMQKSKLTGKILSEYFLSEGDKYLLKKYGGRDLSKFTDINYSVKNCRVYKKGIRCENQPSFSIIMPTYNRSSQIIDGVNSILAQTYDNFELIIIDDGSTDNTIDILNRCYADKINSGNIVLLTQKNKGCSAARNYGLSKAKNDWIVYVDSDNVISNIFLESFAIAILKNHNRFAFYSKLVCQNTGQKIGRKFNYEELKKLNFIDLGTYCHHISLYNELGGFDTKLRRLVDWELILRYSNKYYPIFIDKCLLVYNDEPSDSRITTSVDLYDAFNYIRIKHCSQYPTITTIITTYNHENYISQAIESAVNQTGEFIHEILISDDASTDNTRDIIKYYAKKYPNIVKDVSNDTNVGISMNLKKCFSIAKGKYISILEGDDYWINKKKLQSQLLFMRNNKDCSMVFSRIKILNKGTFSLLNRHNNLPIKLTGWDVIKEPSLNYMANFSCCFFKAELLKMCPDIMFNERFNEIAVSFFMEKYGKIGYISDILSVYRLHEAGVWSAATELDKLISGCKVRKMAFNVARKVFRDKLQSIIQIDFLDKICQILKNKNMSYEEIEQFLIQHNLLLDK